MTSSTKYGRRPHVLTLSLVLLAATFFAVVAQPEPESPTAGPSPPTIGPPSSTVPVDEAPVSAPPTQPPSASPVQDQCVACSPGHFSGTSCASCAQGTCPTLDQCTPCPEGEFAPENGTLKCQACEPGRYAPQNGTISCPICPLGRYCQTQGMNSSVSCPPGTYCPRPGMILPISCSAGFYCPRFGMTFQIQCPAGTYCPQVHMTTPIPCPENHYCIAGSLSADSCPALYKSRQSSSGCKPAPSFFVLIIGVVVLVISIIVGIYIYKTRCMSERVEDIISTKRTRPKHDRTRLLPELSDDDYGYNDLMDARTEGEVPEIRVDEPTAPVEDSAPQATTDSAPQAAPAGRRRQKVPLPPGHTLAHWNALVMSRKRTYPTAKITPKELAKHKSQDDAWVSLNGKVYDVTRYLSYHPGGIPKLMQAAGRDGTALFYKYHSWVNYENLLAADCVGHLVPGDDDEEE